MEDDSSAKLPTPRAVPSLSGPVAGAATEYGLFYMARLS